MILCTVLSRGGKRRYEQGLPLVHALGGKGGLEGGGGRRGEGGREEGREGGGREIERKRDTNERKSPCHTSSPLKGCTHNFATTIT